LSGPYLAIPYERHWVDVTEEIVEGKTRERRTERSEWLVARLPLEAIEWTVEVTTSEKARGIYKARLYSAKVRAKGRIVTREQYGVGTPSGRIRWSAPHLVVGIADPRGIRSVSTLQIGGKSIAFGSGSADGALGSGVHAILGDVLDERPRELDFEFALELAGAEALAIIPLSRDTGVAMHADWPHPSFQGVFLPAKHEIAADGFSAQWRVSRYAAQGAERLGSCERARPCAALLAQEIGVSFIEPVGVYLRLERASKYGFLFIGLTFVAFLLFELFRRLPIHPMQYALVGLALAMFFLLLTALSEHLAFAMAYIAATAACVGLITVYVVYVLRNVATALGFGTVLAGLYGALYMLLTAEDYALLAGSLLLFALLAALMLATRKVDWYGVGRGKAAA
ncbi:MAG TPA: cell envelope integrity protein CreD, partial [Burkholderiales bacterium]|nr:cell envelope integrity protein CreD [Burkholderiales bacterium]